MKTWRWINPYINLVGSKPEYIQRIRSESDIVALREHIGTRSAKFCAVAVELGSGSGGHLIDRAALQPDTLFIGFELRYKRIFRTAEKAEERGLKNILVVQGNASLVPELFAPNSLTTVYMLFPDPWDKTRWKKHRLLTEGFIEKIVTLLKPGGVFSYKSDHAEYFNETVSIVKKIAGTVVNKLTFDLEASEHSVGNIRSEFEQLFKNKQVQVGLVEIKKFGANEGLPV